MADYIHKKIGQIPAFGDWENVKELPLTHYFECARQAGLLHCTACSARSCATTSSAARLSYALPNTTKTRGISKGQPQVKEPMKKRRLSNLMDRPTRHITLPRNHCPKHSNKLGEFLTLQKSSHTVKPIDEDLYKIPAELLENSKRKKMLGFLSKCMVPPCST